MQSTDIEEYNYEYYPGNYDQPLELALPPEHLQQEQQELMLQEQQELLQNQPAMFDSAESVPAEEEHDVSVI